jgi:TolA-binding protein
VWIQKIKSELMRKKMFGFLLIFALTVLTGAQDKSKKTYELIYDDIQFLKQRIQLIEKKIETNTNDERADREQARDILSQLKAMQAQQAQSQEHVRNLPDQIQNIQEKLGQIENLILNKLGDLAVFKAKPSGENENAAAKIDEKIPNNKKTDEVKSKFEKKDATQQPSLSPKEIYNMALLDYSNGRFELSIEGFTLLRDQFGTDILINPLTDNALYMLGECYFSQKKYAQSIEQLDNLISSYPQSDKIAAAYYKKGLALLEMGKKDEAVALFKFLVSKYPFVDEAKSAQLKIRELQEKK